MGRHANPGALLLVYPRSTPPTARPFPLVQVMAATEAQGFGVDPREDEVCGVRGVRGEIGHMDHEGECAVPWVRVICLPFSVPGMQLAASQTLEAGQLEDHLGDRQKAAGGTQRDGVGQTAFARLSLFWVGGENVKNCLLRPLRKLFLLSSGLEFCALHLPPSGCGSGLGRTCVIVML